MVESKQPLSGDVSSLQRQIDAKTRQIAKYFCGTCNAKIVNAAGRSSVIFKLRLPDHDDIVTPAIHLQAKLDPDPVEFFVRTIHKKASKASVQS